MATYEYLPVPGHSGELNGYTSPELLYSYARFTQHGMTIKGGQGELVIGTLMSRGSDKKYVKYTGAAGQKALGFLRRGVDTGAAGAADQLGNLVDSGMVKLELVQAAHGGTSASAGTIASAMTDLNGRVDDANAFISF